MTTTTNPQPTTDDQAITTWCAEVARSHHTYETREWMHYETQEIRDRALVEWTIRCLGNTGYSAAEHTRRVVGILAERQGVIRTYADPSLRDELDSTRVDLAQAKQDSNAGRQALLDYRDANHHHNAKAPGWCICGLEWDNDDPCDEYQGLTEAAQAAN